MAKERFSLQNYSGMAGVFLLLYNNTDAQAVYTDLEPDIEILFDGQTAGVDMDNNGTFDFAFLKSSDTYEWGFSTNRLRKRIWAGPQIITNEIAGDYFYYSAGGGTTYFPYALDSGNLIHDDLSFQNWGYQIMGIAVANTNTPDDWALGGGHWIFSEDFHFLGVNFKGDDDCMHYGWIRCSMLDTAHILVIHDYAYETKCETPIEAGDVVGDTSVAIEEISISGATVYSFGNRVYVNLRDESICNLFVYEMTGKIIYNTHFTNKHFSTAFDIPPGIYMISIEIENEIYFKKIFINSTSF